MTFSGWQTWYSHWDNNTQLLFPCQIQCNSHKKFFTKVFAEKILEKRDIIISSKSIVSRSATMPRFLVSKRVSSSFVQLSMCFHPPLHLWYLLCVHIVNTISRKVFTLKNYCVTASRLIWTSPINRMSVWKMFIHIIFGTFLSRNCRWLCTIDWSK